MSLLFPFSSLCSWFIHGALYINILGFFVLGFWRVDLLWISFCLHILVVNLDFWEANAECFYAYNFTVGFLLSYCFVIFLWTRSGPALIYWSYVLLYLICKVASADSSSAWKIVHSCFSHTYCSSTVTKKWIKSFALKWLPDFLICELCFFCFVQKLLQLPRLSGSIEVWDFLSVDSQVGSLPLTRRSLKLTNSECVKCCCCADLCVLKFFLNRWDTNGWVIHNTVEFFTLISMLLFILTSQPFQLNLSVRHLLSLKMWPIWLRQLQVLFLGEKILVQRMGNRVNIWGITLWLMIWSQKWKLLVIIIRRHLIQMLEIAKRMVG